MKKRWMIVSGLVVLCAALVLVLVFLLPEQEPEVPRIESLRESTTISLDFTEQTNGSWEFYEDLDSRESPAWQDQIYTDGYVINDRLPKLVPVGGNTSLSGGWSEDRTVYVSADGSVELSVTGLTPGVVYRAALFVPCSDGSTGACYSSVVCQQTDERTPAVHVPVSCVPGVYEDLTLIITGNGELYEYTFNVQVQNVSEALIRDRDSGLYNGLYFSAGHRDKIAWLRSGGPVAEESVKQAKSGISIVEPMKKDVYTGFDGAQLLQCTIALDQKYSAQDRFEVSYLLTDENGEQTVAEGSCDAEVKEFGSVSCLTAEILLPETVEEGKYCLHTEVFLSGTEAKSLGSDEVTFSLRKEYDLSALYGQYQTSGLQFNLNCGENQIHNEDATYVTIQNNCLWVELTGMTPGVPYRCALIGQTQSGEPFEVCFCSEMEAEQGISSITSLNVFTQSGIYSDLTLLAYGAGEKISHTFTCEVILPPEQEEEWQDIRRWVDCFRWVSEQPEDWQIPETGYIVDIPEDTVFSGYRGCMLLVPFVFASDCGEEDSIRITLTEESTGKVIEVFENFGMIPKCDRWEIGPVVYEDFTSGAYILHTSIGDQQTNTRIFLEKEKTPREVLGVDGTDGARDVTAYENARIIISKIEDYLDSMEGFDTDIFNQYLRYRYAPKEGMISSFAMISPNVPESEMTIDQEDLLFTANWLIRDTYTFQLKDMKHYSDAKLIDLDAVYAYFADTWKDLKALDYAAGMGKDQDGTVYIWLPVYYENAAGGFEEDQLYLFVYILHQGPDTAYLEKIDYFNPQLYNDYHTTQLLITDQTVVADLLKAMCRSSTAMYQMQDTGEYPTLQLGSEGDAVWKLQRRLQRLGYLTTSVDAVFTPSVQKAVAAWQADMGMEESEEVTEQMQQILHDIAVPRQLLMSWLKNHR